MKKSRDLMAVGVLVALWSRAAFAEEFRVAVACPNWSPEQVSQVEARIRAAILLDGSPPHTIEITCREGAVEVVVRASQGTAQRPVKRTTPSLEDDIVREVDVALRELRRTPPPPEPAPAPAPPEPAPAPTAPLQPARVMAPVPPPERAPTPSWLEARGSGVVERWSEHLALGFEVAPSLGDDRVRYGVAFGASWALGEAKGFEVSNAHAAGELAWSPRFAAGIRGSTALGVSLLTVTPDGSLSADSATALSAAFLQVVLSRPFTFGQLAVAPALGLRAHLAEQRVRVDDVERLVVPLFVPQAQLSLLWEKR